MPRINPELFNTGTVKVREVPRKTRGHLRPGGRPQYVARKVDAAITTIGVGDMVDGFCDDEYSIPMRGKVMEMRAGVATVLWANGSTNQIGVGEIERIADQYEQPLPMEIVAFRPHDRIVLGNGDHGEIIQQFTGPTGFSSWQIKITESVSPLSLGRYVYATEGAMNFRSAGFMGVGDIVKVVDDLRPDMSVSFWTSDRPFVVKCELASTDVEQSIGLQKVSQMPPDRGMVFKYSPAKHVAFHMGTVLFPIDMLFVVNGRVKKIAHNIQPGTTGYWQQDDVALVVEIPGGLSKRSGIKLGTLVTISHEKVAQETFQPNRGDNYPGRTVTPVLPRDDRFVDRFKDRGLPDKTTEDQPMDPRHYDQTQGYDVTKVDDGVDGPAYRISNKD